MSRLALCIKTKCFLLLCETPSFCQACCNLDWHQTNNLLPMEWRLNWSPSIHCHAQIPDTFFLSAPLCTICLLLSQNNPKWFPQKLCTSPLECLSIAISLAIITLFWLPAQQISPRLLCLCERSSDHSHVIKRLNGLLFIMLLVMQTTCWLTLKPSCSKSFLIFYRMAIERWDKNLHSVHCCSYHFFHLKETGLHLWTISVASPLLAWCWSLFLPPLLLPVAFSLQLNWSQFEWHSPNLEVVCFWKGTVSSRIFCSTCLVS